LSAAAFGQMLGFYVIPGASNQAVIVTQGGKVYRLSLSGGAPDLYGDLSARVVDFNTENEGGLLGLAFSPNFQSDHRVYLYFTSNDCGSGAGRCDVLARYTVSANTINTGSEVVLVEVDDPYPNHNGGQILFGPDGYLYFALGDGGSGGDPQGHGQDLSTLLGSILRIDVSGEAYAVPPDNPFVGTAGARPEIFAYGLRNPWRFSFDRATGQLWAADVGQHRWEEVDRIVAGGNYGWNIMEGLACFQPPSGCLTAGLQMPRAVYRTGSDCSVTGGYVYRGPSMPELDGWYVYGDFCSGKIWAVNTVGSAAPVLLADTGLPIASFAELPDGELVVVTFANAVYRLARSS
jgi:glucose/arabinose dehydrogenase